MESHENGDPLGKRLRNPRFLCYLNTAINTVATNRVLREHLLRDTATAIRENNGDNGERFEQQQRVTKELKKIILGNGEIGDASTLRILLSERFPLFRENIQQEAGDAYSSLMDCFSDGAELCSMELRRTRLCLECGKISVREDQDE